MNILEAIETVYSICCNNQTTFEESENLFHIKIVRLSKAQAENLLYIYNFDIHADIIECFEDENGQRFSSSHLMDYVNKEIVLKIKIYYSSTNRIAFLNCTDALLKNIFNLNYNIPENYYIVKDRIDKTTQNKPNQNVIQPCIDFVKFIRYLAKIDALSLNNDYISIASPNDKIDFMINYNPKIKQLDLTNIKNNFDQIKSEIEKTKHFTTDKITILKKCFVNALKNTECDYRFTHLIEHFNELTKSFIHNTELLITGVSFEDDKEKWIKECREFSTSITTILYGIQTQILAIPASTAIFMSQIKFQLQANNATLINGTITIASSILFLIVTLVLWGSCSSLILIKNEISKKKARLEHTAKKCYEDVEIYFKRINADRRRVILALGFAMFINLLSFIGSVFISSYYNPKIHCFVYEHTPIIVKTIIDSSNINYCESNNSKIDFYFLTKIHPALCY